MRVGALNLDSMISAICVPVVGYVFMALLFELVNELLIPRFYRVSSKSRDYLRKVLRISAKDDKWPLFMSAGWSGAASSGADLMTFGRLLC